MTKLKPLFTFLLILAVLVLAYFASLYLADKAKQHELNDNKNSDSQENLRTTTISTDEPLANSDGTEQNISDSGKKSYGSQKWGYRFDYPAWQFSSYQTNMSFPTPAGKSGVVGRATAKVDAFKNVIAVEHCALSGECTPTTTNMTFGSIMRDEQFSLENYPDLEFVGHLYGNTPSWEYTEGAEGEGIVYTFIPHNNKLLILYRTFIDENVITNYKNVKNFITYAKQAEIMTEIIESIKFTN